MYNPETIVGSVSTLASWHNGPFRIILTSFLTTGGTTHFETFFRCFFLYYFQMLPLLISDCLLHRRLSMLPQYFSILSDVFPTLSEPFQLFSLLIAFIYLRTYWMFPMFWLVLDGWSVFTDCDFTWGFNSAPNSLWVHIQTPWHQDPKHPDPFRPSDVSYYLYFSHHSPYKQHSE